MINQAEGESPFSILMVDDDPMLQNIGRAILEHCGCRVEVARSGREALDAFARQRYDMVFMDCQMPGMDGYETTGVIREMETKNRENGATSRIPIVALTGYATEEVKERCLEVGMDDYLSKPFSIKSIQSILERWLITRPLEKQEGEGNQDSPDIKMPKGSVRDLNRQEEPPPIDRAALDMISSLQPPGEYNILKKIIFVYLDNSSTLLKSVRGAVEGKDADALRQAAHTLKSSSANLGALIFSEICKKLEVMGRDKALVEAKACLADLEHEYARVRESLEKHCNSLP
jgi:two-component system, sensor histidine kinase and response regulator